MQEEKISSIRSGLETAYINGNVASELSYKPNFVSIIIVSERKYYPL